MGGFCDDICNFSVNHSYSSSSDVMTTSHEEVVTILIAKNKTVSRKTSSYMPHTHTPWFIFCDKLENYLIELRRQREFVMFEETHRRQKRNDSREHMKISINQTRRAHSRVFSVGQTTTNDEYRAGRRKETDGERNECKMQEDIEIRMQWSKVRMRHIIVVCVVVGNNKHESEAKLSSEGLKKSRTGV